MTNLPASSVQPPQDQELLDVAARLVGVQTVDLMHVVRRADGSLVVILCTGQKYVFSPEQMVAQLGTDVETWIRAQLNSTPAPAADPAPAKPVGAKQAPPDRPPVAPGGSPRAKK